MDSTSLVVDPPHSFIITIIIFFMLSPSSLIDYLVSVNSTLGLREGERKGKGSSCSLTAEVTTTVILHHHHLHHHNHGSPAATVDPEQHLEHQAVVQTLGGANFLGNFSATAPIIHYLASMMVKGAITELSPVDPERRSEQRLEHQQWSRVCVERPDKSTRDSQSWSGPRGRRTRVI